jgi:3-phosphoshikimate 1-carboxyvinyltransferase
VPGDKSISHRLAIFGALAHGETHISNFSSAEDCASTLACLRALGVRIERRGNEVRVGGRGPEALGAPEAPLDAGNSGSTLRMLAGVLAGRPFRSVLTGDASLRRRPVERVAKPLRSMGARVTSTDGRPPLTIEGGTLRAIDHRMEVASAQVKSAVLLAGLLANGRTSVSEPSPSRDHTERLLPAFGVAVTRRDCTASLEGGQRLRAASLEAPGDASSAAFLVVAALILGDSEVRLENVLLNPTRTAFLDVLRAMGARIDVEVERSDPEPVGSIVAGSSELRGTSVGPEIVPALIDEIPALAVAGALAAGEFEVRGAAELRVKESDRIAALCEGLRAMGVSLVEREDGFRIHGGSPLHSAAVRSHGDHRIAMALAVAALAARGDTQLHDADCVGVSFPEFFELMGAGRGA